MSGLIMRKREDEAGENYLFFIGIDNYSTGFSLQNCVKDVNSLAEVLTTRYEFKYENLIFLTDEQATRKNIYAKFLDLIFKLKEEDSIIIYYAGLGYVNGWTKEVALVPVDGNSKDLDTCIELSVIEKWLNSFKTKHVIFISDSNQHFNSLNHGWNIKQEDFREEVR